MSEFDITCKEHNHKHLKTLPCVYCYTDAQADEIERLEAKVEALTKENKTIKQQLVDISIDCSAYRRITELEAEVVVLRREKRDLEKDRTRIYEIGFNDGVKTSDGDQGMGYDVY